MPRFSSTLREHASYPSNRGKLEGATTVGRASISNNPPYVTIYLQIAENLVSKAKFESEGCGVTTAVCSAVTEMIENKTILQCQQVTPENVAQSLDGIPADKMHCAQVVVRALNSAIDHFLESQA